MDTGDAVLLGLVAVLAANHVVVRLPGWERRGWIFWLIQIANLASTVYLVGVGIPGLTGDIRIFNYVLALLFTFRTVQNNRRWGDARRNHRAGGATAAAAKRASIEAALRAGDDDPTETGDPPT